MRVRSCVLVTTASWTFTITDGALRMLVLLYFHDLGYGAVSLSLLFLLYEVFGVVTNLVGGLVDARHGLHRSLQVGLGLQVLALALLSIHSPQWHEWLAVIWVMGAQALSGIAKDLVRPSAETAARFASSGSRPMRLAALLTGSQNAPKGVGFFVGAVLLEWRGFNQSLLIMAVAIAVMLAAVFVLLDDIGRATDQPAIGTVLPQSPEIKRLSMARFFLVGSRDIWFVVALPLFLVDTLGWSFGAIGVFLAIWIIGYGAVHAAAPGFLADYRSMPYTATALMMLLAICAGGIAVALWFGELKALLTVAGLLVFGVLFALVSDVHSYLIEAYSRHADESALDAGFYNAANAAGRLAGTLLSGLLYLVAGLPGALAGTVVFLGAAIAASAGFPDPVEESTDTATTAIAAS